jgi:ABC-type transport system involved in multi-copper enzyme maturation permease subunit
MRVLLAICLLGIALLASFFLRQRKLTMVETLAWGMLILLVPLLGPFLVILLRPGSKSMPAN